MDKQWFETDDYYITDPIPKEIPYDKLACIRVFGDKTQPGWGAADFMDNYVNNAFSPERAARHFERYSQPFAFLMRSIPGICVDIDGKNDGIANSKVLQLQPTLAEPSKSGNGYHAFYSIPSVWGPRGYEEIGDVIGLIKGVDIKGTGAVFHYPNQRWNGRPMAPLPESLYGLINNVSTMRRAARITKEGTANLDEDELVLVHDQLKIDLEKKIEPGQRNQRLFAIGARMQAASYPNWDIALFDRGLEIGLEMDEVQSIINHINKYA